MVLYRLILLSWIISYNVVYGKHGRLIKKQRIANPLQQNQRMVNNHQGMGQQRTVNNPLNQQRTGNTVQGLNQHRLANPQQAPAQQRMVRPQQGGMNGQHRINHPPQVRFHHQRPTHVKAHSKDLMSQVVSSTLHNRPSHGRGVSGIGDNPHKYVDYYDNGANWDHFISKPENQDSEMNIDDSNYHVHLKYGGHDELEENDKLNGNHNMETYPGETISGENSLSKFMAPPVYDEENEAFQQNKEQIEAEEKYKPDTPEAAETEQRNTDQLVSRLNSLMTPLSPPFDSDSDKKNKLNRMNAMHGGKNIKQMYQRKHQGPPHGDESYESSPQQESALTREKMMRYGARAENNEGRYRRPETLTDTQAEERMRVLEKERERYRHMREGASKVYHDSEREMSYYQRNRKNGAEQHDEEEDENDNNEDESYQRARVAAILRNRRLRGRYEELYRERMMNNRGNPRHGYGRRADAEQEDEREESNENSRENETTVDAKDDSRSLINLKRRPENEFDSKFSRHGVE